MKPSFRLAFGIALTALSLSAAVGTADAANPFDGSWWVTITTTRGSCSSGGMFRLEVRNGGVYGGGNSADRNKPPLSGGDTFTAP